MLVTAVERRRSKVTSTAVGEDRESQVVAGLVGYFPQGVESGVCWKIT